MEMIFVKPVDGGLIPNPELGDTFLLQDGDFVPLTAYWSGHLMHGDVVKAKPPEPAPAAPAKSSPAPAKDQAGQ